MNIDKRPPRIPGIYQCIGLQIDHGAVSAKLSLRRSYNTKGDAVLKAKRTTERHSNLPHPYRVRIGQCKRRQTFPTDLQECNIGKDILPEDLRFYAMDVLRRSREFIRMIVDGHHYRRRMFDNVCVGEDQAGAIDDDPRADGTLSANQGGIGQRRILDRSESAYLNLYD